MQTFQIPAPKPYRARAEFSRDGRFLGIGEVPYALLDVTSGEVLTTQLTSAHGYRLVRDGSAVIYLTRLGGPAVVVRDFRTDEQVRRGFSALYVNDLAVSPDEKRVYLALRPDPLHVEVRILNPATFRQLAVFGRHKGYIYQLALSGDGRLLAAQSSSWPGCRIRVWDLSRPKLPGRARAVIDNERESWDFALSHDGSRLVTANGKAVRVWDTKTGKRLASSWKHQKMVRAVACSPKQPFFVSGDAAGSVFLWDTGGRVLKRYDWGLGEVYALAFDADGLRAAAVDVTGKVVVWDADG